MTRTSILTALALAVPLLGACDTGEQADMDEPFEQAEDTLQMPQQPASMDTAGAILAIDTLEDAGAYITDGEGRALYLFTADDAGTSTCYDACAEAWPPLMAENGATTDAPEIQQSLIGTTERRDGQRQVTYGGHPLYYFSQDAGPGDTVGQDMQGQGGEWYLVTPAGEPLEGDEEG